MSRYLNTLLSGTAMLRAPVEGAGSAFSITVTTDIAPYSTGQTLTDVSDIAAYMRGLMAEAEETVPDGITDQAIYDAVASAEVTGLDADDTDIAFIQAVQAWEPGETDTDPVVTPQEVKAANLSAKELSARADTLAKELDAMPEVVSAIGTGVAAKEETRFNPARVYRAIKADKEHGEAFLNSLPEPGSDKTSGANRGIWDKYDTFEPNGKGGTKTVHHSVLNEIADRTKRGREIEQAIADINANSGRFAGLDKDAKESELATWNGRRNNNRNTFRSAVALHFKKEKLELYGGTFGWVMVPMRDGDGKPVLQNGRQVRVPTTNTVCIRIGDAAAIKNDPANAPFWNMDVSKFLNLDFDAAKKAGGTMEDLISTMKKKRKAGAKTGGGKDAEGVEIKPIANDKQASVFMGELVAWLGKPENRTKITTILYGKKGGKPVDGSDDMLGLVLGLAGSLSEWNTPKNWERLNAIKTRDAA